MPRQTSWVTSGLGDERSDPDGARRASFSTDFFMDSEQPGSGFHAIGSGLQPDRFNLGTPDGSGVRTPVLGGSTEMVHRRRLALVLTPRVNRSGMPGSSGFPQNLSARQSQAERLRTPERPGRGLTKKPAHSTRVPSVVPVGIGGLVTPAECLIYGEAQSLSQMYSPRSVASPFTEALLLSCSLFLLLLLCLALLVLLLVYITCYQYDHDHYHY